MPTTRIISLTLLSQLLAAIALVLFDERLLIAQPPGGLGSEIRTAWQSNLEKMGSLEAVFEMTINKFFDGKPVLEDPPRVYDLKLSVNREKVIILKQKRDDPTKTTKYYFDGATWSEHRQQQRAVIVRMPDQMPGAYPFDLRESFMHDLRTPFSACVLSMTFSAPSSQEGLIQGTFEDGDTSTLRVQFDKAMSMLPVSSVHSVDNGNPLRSVQIVYKHVDQRNAFFPSRIITQTFGSPDYKYPNGSVTYDLKDLKLLEGSDPKFEYPSDTRVIDLASNPMDGRNRKVDSSRRNKSFFLLSSLLVVLGILFWKFRKGKAVT